MPPRPSGIRYILGKRDFLIVAPHGPFINGVYENEVRTGIIAEAIQESLDCHAIINDLFFKPKGPITKSFENYFLDIYRIDHAGKVPDYLSRIEKVVKSGARTIVVWLHGITDDVADNQGRQHQAIGQFDDAPEKLDALIGYGQGGDFKTGDTQSSYSARIETVEAFRDHLCAGGLTTIISHPQAARFIGRDSKRLNQWFLQLGYGFDRVESMHFETREKGLRDTEENAVKTGKIIANALSHLADR